MDSSGSAQGPVTRSCLHGNEDMGYVKYGQFLISQEAVIFSRMSLLHGVRYVNIQFIWIIYIYIYSSVVIIT